MAPFCSFSASSLAATMRIADHFEPRFVRGEQKRCCKYCARPYSMKSGHGTLSDHMNAQHKSKLTPPTVAAAAATASQEVEDSSDMFDMTQSPQTGAAAAAAAASSSSSVLQSPKRAASAVFSEPESVKRQTTLPSMLAAASNASLPEQVALFFAANHIAYNVADSATFIALCHALRNSSAPPPRRTAVKNAVGTLADKMRTAVVQRITGGTAPVTVAIDGWTNVRHTKVTNVVLLCSGVAFYWCSIPNTYDANTAEWLRDQLAPRLQELVAHSIRFTALVADNESVNDALFVKLQRSFPFLIRIPCAAHTIQLVVKQIMTLKRFADTLDTVRSIISRFEKSKPDRLHLRAVQAREQHQYVLVKPCDTRWNSTLKACQRILLLRRFISIIVLHGDDFWTALQQLIDYLVPFETATNVTQRDASTLFDVYTQMNLLLQHIAAGRGTYGADVTKRATGFLKERWNKQVNQPATIACALLTLTADLSSISPAVIAESKHFIVTFGSSYLSFFHLSPLDERALGGLLLQQLASLIGRRDDFARLDEQMRLLQDVATDKRPFNPLDVWDMHSGELCLVAKALLSITASEAAVERTFSAQGEVHTKKRNRLLDEAVQQEMFVKFNSRALDREQHYQLPPAVIELSPDADLIPLPSSDESSDTDESDADEPPAAAAAADSDGERSMDHNEDEGPIRGPARTASALNAEMHAFLEGYIISRGITLEMCKRWGVDRTNALEAAIIEARIPGAYVAEDCKPIIKQMLSR